MVFLITFRSYGTWLHGDERGSVDHWHNQPGAPLLEAKPTLQNYRRSLMKSERALLDENCRACVAETIRDVVLHRNWNILALEVLSNHVHVVIDVPEVVKPEKILSDLKAWTTRRLRENSLVPPDVPIWEHHGSTRYLWNEKAVAAACQYVCSQIKAE